MTARVGYGLSALVLGLGALVGVQHSGATFTDDSDTSAQVAAAADWAEPAVVVTPLDAGIFDTVTVTATASDDRSDIASVELQYAVAGSGSWTVLTSGCTATSGPSPLVYSCEWDTTTVDDGDYEVRAVATDAASPFAFTGVSASVPTQVANAASVVLTTVPDLVHQTVSLTADYIGSGTAKLYVEHLTGGSWTQIGSCFADRVTTLTCSWNTTSFADGSTTLRARAVAGKKTLTDEQSGIVVDNAAPTVTVNKAAGQADPTVGATINFTAVFSEVVTGFDSQAVTVSGSSPGIKTVTVTGSGPTYNVAVTGMTGNGSVIASVAASAVTDQVGNLNQASTHTDNSVVYDAGGLTSVHINQGAGQADPTRATSVTFDVVFSKPVTGFGSEDVSVTGAASGTKTVGVTGSGATYVVTVSGLSGSGTVTATVVAAAAVDSYGNATLASTSTDNTITRDVTAPTLTINQAAGQTDPSNATTVNFAVVFSEPVTDFTSIDVTVGGTAAGTKVVTVTGSGDTYNVAVAGATGNNVTVTITVAANVAVDLAGNSNVASTNTDNSITRDTTRPTATVARASGQSGTTTTSPINFTVTFSEAVADFGAGDVTLAGTSPGTKIQTVTGGPTVYNVAVSNMTGDGTVIASVSANAATDTAGNGNTASGTATVTYSNGLAPSVTVNQAASQADPTNGVEHRFHGRVQRAGHRPCGRRLHPHQHRRRHEEPVGGRGGRGHLHRDDHRYDQLLRHGPGLAPRWQGQGPQRHQQHGVDQHRQHRDPRRHRADSDHRQGRWSG